MAENLINIALADDDEGMRQVLRKIIERAPGYALVGEAKNGEEMLALYDDHRPQVVFLDVEMPLMNGVDTARAIQDRNPLTIIVFLTAHDHYMKDAFELYAFDYILKQPFRVERVLNTLSLIKERLTTPRPEPPEPIRIPPVKERPARLMLRHREGINFVDLDEVLLIQREDRMTVVYSEGGRRYATSESMGELEARLPDDLFFRCHKSYIVNVSHVDSISPYGRWTHIIKLRGAEQDALITHERLEILESLFR